MTDDEKDVEAIVAARVSVKEVWLAIVRTVPTSVPPELYRPIPTANSVWKRVPDPVTVVELPDVLIVPVLATKTGATVPTGP